MPSPMSETVRWRSCSAWVGPLAMPAIQGLVRHFLPPQARDEANTRAVAVRLAGKLDRMPLFAGLPVLVLTLAFGTLCLVMGRRSPARQSARQIGRSIGLWRRIPIGPTRDLLQVYERLAPFIHYDLMMAAPGNPARTACEPATPKPAAPTAEA